MKIRDLFLKIVKVKTCRVKTLKTSTVVTGCEGMWRHDIKKKLSEQLAEQIMDNIKLEVWEDSNSNRLYGARVKIIMQEGR